jgi:hypothetical protein
MGITRVKSTIPGGYTPVCNRCGIHLCWDISDEEARSARAFWDAWVCEDCNEGVAMSLKSWKQATSQVGTRANTDPRSPVEIHQ